MEVAYKYFETPAFEDVTRYAISFVFELHLTTPKQVGARGKNSHHAFRLESISRALEPDAEAKNDAHREHRAQVYRSLFEPVESFHDDITSGAPGRGGRPLAFLARGRQDLDHQENNDEDAVTLIRPRTWTYRAEGATIEMHAPADETGRTLKLLMRDSFFVFESGRIYYILSLLPPDDGSAPLSEYALIQLMKLVYPHFGTTALRDALRFRAGQEEHNLINLVTRRLQRLASDQSKTPNGVRDVLHNFILEKGETLAPPTWRDLQSAVIGLENTAVIEAFDSVAETTESLKAFGANVLEHVAPENNEPAAHIPLTHPKDAARALALAGVLQSVPDFPFQDSSEIWDSTRYVYGGKGRGFALFSHPKFLIEIAADWRSLSEGRDGLGHCPYLLLTWLVAAHDEMIASEMEEQLDLIIYGKTQEPLLRAEPLKGLSQTVTALTRQFLPGPSVALRESLELRLDVFRRLNIHRSRHIFRYETEATTLTKLNEKRGTTDRIERATEILDRYENLVEDVQDMARMASDQRLNMFLAIVAGFSVISAFADMSELGVPMPLRFSMTGLSIAVGLVLVWILLTKTRR